MTLKEYFIFYDNKKNKHNMIQKQEFEKKLDDYLFHSIFRKKNASKILDIIECYPYKEDINILLEKLSLFIHNKELYQKITLDKLIQMDLDIKDYCILFNKLSYKQRKIFLKLCIENMSNIKYESLKLGNDEKKIIKNSLDEVLTYYKDLFSLKSLFNNDKNALLKINEYINNNNDRMIENMIEPLYYEKESRKDSKVYIKMIVDDIIKNENASYSDVKREKSGGYSCVYSIKNKVIKLGSNGRITPTFPNNPYIVKPLLRKTFRLDEKNIFIEVTQKVDNNEKNITKEDLYNLYSKLRDLKIRWTDVHTSNVGVLLQDNKIYWHNDLTPTDESLGLQKYRKDKELKAGDFVILDADFMYDENDKKLKMAVNSFDREFEIRYLKERKLKK